MPISPRDYEGISQRLTEAGVRITDNVAVALQGLHSSVIQDPDNISRAANIYTRRIAAATRQWERDWREWADKDILHAYKIGVSHTDAEIRAIRERGINVRTPERPVTNRQAMTANLPPLTLDRNIPSWMKKEFKLLPNHLTAFNVFRRAAYHYLEGTGLQIMRASKDIYRKTAVEVMSKSFRESDVFTRRKFSQSMLNEFADKGLKSVTYRNGKKVSIEAYSEMLGRTMPAHASVQASLNRYSEHGYDLVRVTSHFRACELCVPYEGAILSSSGMSSGYESLDSAVANGLFHPNCLHAVNPYIPGLSQKQEIRVDPAEQKLIDEHGYKEAQKIAYQAQERQRQIERNIRVWKKREIVALDTPEKVKAHTKVLKWQEAQRNHVGNNPFLIRKYEYEKIVLDVVVAGK